MQTNNKLKCIVLIDDSEATNFFHELIIKEVDCTEQIASFQSGRAALDFLVEKTESSRCRPDIFFLDINMPGMNGWEFLEEYKVWKENQQCKAIMVMLTTSLNPDDKEKADNMNEVDEFMSKPLDSESLFRLIKKYFPEVVLNEET
jgi:CheY-like chemotaxis protein